MNEIKLYPLQHKGKPQIAVSFTYNREIKDSLKMFPGLYWSKTHSVFYTANTSENKQKLYQFLSLRDFRVNYSELQPTSIKKTSEKESKPLSKEAKKSLWDFVFYLKGKRLSQSSIKTYYNFVLKFVEFQTKPFSEINNRDVELFIEKIIAGRNYSISSHRQCISALKHFGALNNFPEIDVDKFYRPKKSNFLPTVLSQEEVIRLLQATRNLKHRAVLALIYSSGLRIGELLNLKLSQIDVDRRQIFVVQSKGRKDRYVVMADSFIPLLFNYLHTYKPGIYFVEGLTGKAYSPSSIRSFLKESCRRAKIYKKVTPHTLRHSYATHMLENGIGLRHIQELLGHSKPETTMIYTHVAQKDLMQIKSPLDMAIKKHMENGKGGENLRLSGV